MLVIVSTVAAVRRVASAQLDLGKHAGHGEYGRTAVVVRIGDFGPAGLR